MKTTFFAAALLALAATPNAVSLYSEEDFEYDFGQLDTNTDLDIEGDAAASTITDAECEQLVGGVVIRLQTPEC